MRSGKHWIRKNKIFHCVEKTVFFRKIHFVLEDTVPVFWYYLIQETIIQISQRLILTIYIESNGKMRFGTIWATDHNDNSR